MASSSGFSWPFKPEGYAPHPVPGIYEFENLWTAWDIVTMGMIPKEELLAKPIKLRNACIFYLGHIPTFLDIHLTRATGGKLTEPGYYPSIFERGVDPDVEDPEKCHAHSEIPDEYPPLADILQFQYRVRERVRDLYSSGAASTDRKLGRALWLGFEHEVMHLETLLYMLVQSENTLSPPGMPTPDFEARALEAEKARVPNEWFTVPESKFSIGMSDPENDNGPDRYFGWDNERPPREVAVSAFKAQARPITNGEYAEYLIQSGSESFPASWTTTISQTNGYHNGNFMKSSHGHVNGQANGESNGVAGSAANANGRISAYLQGKAVRTVYGAIPLKLAYDWPVMASYDELAGYAKWANGRIPSLEEVQSIYSYVDQGKCKEAERYNSRTISAVNG